MRAKARIAEENKQHAATKKDMSDLEKEMKDALDVRNAENAAFKDAIKADSDATMLLAKAIEALSKFHEKHALLQKQDPEYTTDPNLAAEADAAYRALLKESQEAMDAMEKKCVDLKAAIAEENKDIADLQETYDDKQAQKDAT